jgi:hypothetical protein
METRTDSWAAIAGALALVASVAACGAGAGGVTGPPRDARVLAARSFDEAVGAYGRGETARALAAFERAFALAPSAAVLFNIARVHDAMGHAPQAARYYVAYLRAAGDVISPSQRREIDDALTRIATQVGWVVVRTRDAPVTIDGVRLLPWNAGGPVAVWPGVRTVRVGEQAPVAVRAHVGEVVALDFDNPDAMLYISAEPAAPSRPGGIFGVER